MYIHFTNEDWKKKCHPFEEILRELNYHETNEHVMSEATPPTQGSKIICLPTLVV